MKTVKVEEPRNNPERTETRSPYIDIKEAVSYDIKLHGAKVIIAEFTAATVLGAGVTMLYALSPSILLASRLFGLFWLGLFFNFLTILTLSISLARRGTRKEREIELSNLETGKLRKYTLLIGLAIILPYATLALGLRQHLHGEMRE